MLTIRMYALIGLVIALEDYLVVAPFPDCCGIQRYGRRIDHSVE